MSIKIITDSTSYLTGEQISKYGIEVISLHITYDQESFLETEMNSDDFYHRLANDKTQMPKSSQPNLERFTAAFEEPVKAGDEVIGIFLSSEMSGTYQTACMIRQELIEKYSSAKIHLVDSKTNCMELGFQVLKAAEMASKGASSEDIVTACHDLKDRSKFIFMPGTLEYLKRGGRIGTAKALVGNLLKITPLLTVTDGITQIFAKVRTKKKALCYLLDYFEEQIEDHGLGNIIVHHIQNEEEGLSLAKKLQERLKIPVQVQPIGPVIGCHVGPGAIGIAYYTQRKRDEN